MALHDEQGWFVSAVLASRIRLKLAFVTELYPPSIGGQQTRFENLARGLTRLGDSVTVFCIDSETESRAFEVRDGVTVIRGPRLASYERSGVFGIDRSLTGMLRFGLRTRRELKRRDFDAVYFNQWPYLHVALATRATRRVSGIDWCEVRGGPLHGTFERVLPRLVAFNESVNEWVAAQIGAASGRHVGYLPTGVDAKQYASTPGGARSGILFLGRFVPNKNLPLLIEAYGALRRRGVTEPLRIAGDGPERTAAVAAVERLEPEYRSDVTFLGTVDDAGKRELLATSKVLAVPSLREGFPNVVTEAAASGLPVATTTSPQNGTAHVVGKYGIGTIGAATPDGFADALSGALDRFDELSERCRQIAVDLDWSVLAQQLHDTLEAACVGHGATRADR
jgi:glycosyltransferase involved in cell wall biosynthesis